VAAWATAIFIDTSTCRASSPGAWAGKSKQGIHYAYRDNMPMTNLLLTILDKVGAHVDKLGDSTHPLPL
jgi:hypothetical protein